ncbi:ABC transporter permease [Lentimicrobium sp. S6]|uniref:ABC transporter permease n=1 Tax=Lentimicrobium sp. S6 TaxID=2735872 RepID=UPI001553F957|nr:hypothetical protein [Lentimicrobium sp. S6]NPD48104.1 hypothetical protein [Lentimicrobium sp. S6]
MKVKIEHRNTILRIILIPVFLLVWQIFYYLNLFEGQIPSVISVFKVFFKLENSLEIMSHIGKTLYIFIQCLILGSILGYTIGVLMGLNKIINIIFYNFFNAIKSIPITILLPIAFIVFKLSHFLVPLLSLPVIAILAVNISDACNNINKNRFEIISLIKIRKYEYFKHVIFFETLEVFFSTLRVLVTYVIAVEIALDYFLNLNKGIGFFIYKNYSGSVEYLPKMYAGIIVVAILGIGLIKILDLISKKAILWKKQI